MGFCEQAELCSVVEQKLSSLLVVRQIASLLSACFQPCKVLHPFWIIMSAS